MALTIFSVSSITASPTPYMRAPLGLTATFQQLRARLLRLRLRQLRLLPTPTPGCASIPREAMFRQRAPLGRILRMTTTCFALTARDSFALHIVDRNGKARDNSPPEKQAPGG